MSRLDEFNEVIESLFRSGTRYRSQKFIILGAYVAIVGLSIAWAFIGVRKARGLEAEFQSHQIQSIEDKTFTLLNVGTLNWHDVRVAIKDKYLIQIAKLESGSEKTLTPEDFKYYFHVPRPWGATQWERLGQTPRPPSHAPSELELDGSSVHVWSREGKIDVTFKRK